MIKQLKIFFKTIVILFISICLLLFFACGTEGGNEELPNLSDEQEETTQRERLINVLVENGFYNDGEYNLPHDILASNGVMFYNTISFHEESGTILIETSSNYEDYTIEIVFYLYKSHENGFIMTNFYDGGNIVFIGMGEVSYEGFMENDTFTFSDVAGMTTFAPSVETLTISALHLAITSIDSYLSQFDAYLDFIGMWF